MIIGVPKEIMPDEGRVAVIPETAEKLIELGHDVLVEKGAGEKSHHSDDEYISAGVTMISSAKELYEKADLILKVKEPRPNKEFRKHEVDMMKQGASLICFLHPAAPQNHENVERLRARWITSFTMDSIPRVDRAFPMDALISMSTVTGYKAVIMCAERLQRFVPPVKTTMGAIEPATFLIVGAGVVGRKAIITAGRLGARVWAVDVRESAKELAMELGADVKGFDIPEEVAVGDHGCARSLPVDWLKKAHSCLEPLMGEVDAVISSALVPGEVAPVLITEKMVKSMKKGSVIIDVAVDQGGNCELTEPGKEVVKHGVLISGIQNIPGRVPIHSTWLYAHNVFNFFVNLTKKDRNTFDLEDEIVRETLVTHEGKIVHAGTLKAMEKRRQCT